MQHLLRAIELDPTLISAKVDLAHLCVAQALYGFMSPSAAAELVHRMAESIPDLPHQAEALLPALGWVNFHFDRNLPAALLAFSFSAHLPHDPWTTRVRTMFAVSRHRFAEAIELLREAIRHRSLFALAAEPPGLGAPPGWAGRRKPGADPQGHRPVPRARMRHASTER